MISKIIAVLALLASYLDRWQRRNEKAAHDREVEEIYENPSAWFDDHFNSRLRDAAKNAPDTDKAGAPKP